MESDDNNKLTYTGIENKAFMTTLNLTARIQNSSGNNRVCNFMIFRNGIKLTNAQISSNLRENGQTYSLSLTIPIILKTDDYIEVWCENTENTTNIVVTNISLICIAMSYKITDSIIPASTTTAF